MNPLIKKLKVLAFASGYGSTLEHLLKYETSQNPQWTVTGVVCDNPRARALTVAKQYARAAVLVSRQDFKSGTEFDHAIFKAVEQQSPDVIFLLGYLKKVDAKLINSFSGRIFNSHPSLLPKYGGKKMYGRAVHEAVLRAGELETGVTLHEVNENYDSGRVRVQKKIQIKSSWTVDEVENAVKIFEKQTIVEFLNQIAGAGAGAFEAKM